MDVPKVNPDKAVWPQSRVDDGMDDDSVLDKINNKHETLKKIWAPAPAAAAPAPVAAAQEGGEEAKPAPKEGEATPAPEN